MKEWTEVMMKEWTDKWPEEEGFYWFYGWCFKSQMLPENPQPPELHFVKVRKTALPFQFAYITDGHFLYKEEGAAGMFRKVDLPDVQSQVMASILSLLTKMGGRP